MRLCANTRGVGIICKNFQEHAMASLGINIGSTSVKATMLEEGRILWSAVEPHEGNFIDTLKNILSTRGVDAGTRTIATGTEGRHLVNVNSVIEPLCIEAALESLALEDLRAVVTMGGENLVVYTVGNDNKIITSFTGNKCFSGTGEFFQQQLGRMNMHIEDINTIPEESRVCKLSSRCSVFMKSDCTHRLNKGEASKGDIVLSLSDVMAGKVMDFLKRARVNSGKVLLTGGITLNRHIVAFIREKLPQVEFIVPEEAGYFEAYGAALIARTSGSMLPEAANLVKEARVAFRRFKSLKQAEEKVTFIPSKKGTVRPGREYILGVDGGSTTTKACLIDTETHEIAASYYGRTHGDPVKALKNCIIELKKQIHEALGDVKLNISLAAATGSSREILGVFLETPGVYNEIIAHAVGTTYYDEEIDTIFEIGGQDAKYVYLQNKVPIDYAMNEACSAGTGSFLEESAAGDLNIKRVEDIAEIAVSAGQPLKFGEHCSAFINSDIRNAIQQGASREDITAGLITSIVSNYLNRVVGNRSIGKRIVLQGGVAKNRAVPMAFAMLLNKEILVPPDPELMGCFGVALLAQQKNRDGLLEKGSFDLDAVLNTDIVYEREFKCKACDNYCPIKVLSVNGHKYMFGGRCNMYANMRKKKQVDEEQVRDWVEERNKLLFETCVPDPESLEKRRDYIVGIPKAFSVYSLNPLYRWFFHELGIETLLSEDVSAEGSARVESAYCFPAEIAHGAVQDMLNKGADYIFLPHFRDLESQEEDMPGNFCPITQALPYYIQKAFPEISEDRILRPVVSLMYGLKKAADFFVQLAVDLGFTPAEGQAAFDTALEHQNEYFARTETLGAEALEWARSRKEPVIAILGRPYNAFTQDANMGIPRKFTSRGYTVIPFDILAAKDREIFPNMYWYYGQLDMKAAELLKDEPNIYVTWITNFSCAPDSFMLHYLKWIMGIKPFLILELDSHSADAGVDTRVEAFLDIIEGYRSKIKDIRDQRYDNGLRFINEPGRNIHVLNRESGERKPIQGNPRVKVLLSNMGRIGTELTAAAMRGAGWSAEALPVADQLTLQMARNYASGKECVPSHLVLGSALKFFASENYRKDEIYLLFVPTTKGPCRTGQYFVFFQNLFRDLRLENVLVFTLDADNSYNELGPGMTKQIWWAFVASDYMKDVETALRTCAENPREALETFDTIWTRLIEVTEQEGANKIIPTLEGIADEISAIPLKRDLKELPKVLVVGEIYVRRDDFAVDELVGDFARHGIMAKVAGITEWIWYLDFVKEYDLKKRLKLLTWYRRPFSRVLRQFIMFHLERRYKLWVEGRILKTLNKTGLVPHTPHDMYAIMKNASKHFVNHELKSEITISTAAAATAMEDDYSGIVNISPFACLIGRVIEGLYTPWARERNYPVMSVEIDGNLLPPSTLSKLEIFMLNVLRFRNREAGESMIEHEGVEELKLSRIIVKDLKPAGEREAELIQSN